MREARPSIPGVELGELRRTAGRLATYDAIERSTRRPVVVSSIAPGDDDYLELVLAHQRAIQALSAPHVQQVLDSGIDADGKGYVVAARVEGQPLDEAETGGSIDRLGDIAEAVRGLHERDLAHGALSPENIVVQPDGTLMLLNAGLAGYVDDSASVFQPDEQSLRPRPIVADDVFALGALGWWLQTGHTPDKPGSLGAPAHVEAALRRALDFDAGNRQWTVREFLYELEHTVDENRSFVPTDHGASALPPAGLGPRKLPILLGAAGALALLIGAFTVFRPSDPDIPTEVLGITTVPTTETTETTLTTLVTSETVESDATGADTESTAVDAGTATTLAAAGTVAPPTTARRPATTTTKRPQTTSPPTTQPPAPEPTITVTPLPPLETPPSVEVTVPTLPPTTPAPTTAAPTTTTTAKPATTTTAKPTTTTTAKPATTTTTTTTKAPATTATTAGAVENIITRNPVLPDTPVTGN